MHQLIHKNDGIKVLGFAELTLKARLLWVSPGQSTFCRKCGCRALIKSFEIIDFIMYLFG